MEQLEITLFWVFFFAKNFIHLKKKRVSGSIDSGHLYLRNLADFCCFSSFRFLSLFKSLELLQDVMAKSVPTPGDKLYDLVSLEHRSPNQHEQNVLGTKRGNVAYKTKTWQK